MVICYLGLGSNLGNREKNIKSALRRIGVLRKTRLIKSSSLFDTDPEGCPAESPRFLNAAAKISTGLAPFALLKELKTIERNLGRKAAARFYPREIDLDILLYGDKKVNSPSLRIPHPRLKQRDFVIRPMKEVAPSIVKTLAQEIKVISGICQMRNFMNRLRASRTSTVGFVPTMGYLHRGHLSLIAGAKKECDLCVVSIFVNPAQFGPEEDLNNYPRDLERDRILAKSAGADVIFCPRAKDMYPGGYCSYVNVEKVTDFFCGKSRPGHFKGVATVVLKLFNVIQPDLAYFGQKDYQQTVVIKKMVKDMNIPLDVRVMPVVRGPDGLALSSRNTYLSQRERADAPVLFQSLKEARDMVIRKGIKDSVRIYAHVRNAILRKKTAKIEYITIADAKTLAPIRRIEGRVVIALAVRIGKTRLIDNVLIG